MGMEWGGFEGGRGNHLAEGGGWHSEGREKVGESSGWGTHGGPRGGGGGGDSQDGPPAGTECVYSCNTCNMNTTSIENEQAVRTFDVFHVGEARSSAHPREHRRHPEQPHPARHRAATNWCTL